MAKNIRQGGFQAVTRIGIVADYPTSPASGGVALCGQLAGVAEGIKDANNITVINLDCVAELPVLGSNGSNVAVTAGDVIYASQADPVVLSKTTSGIKVGIAFGNALTDNSADTRTGTLVASGATTTIRVLVGHYT